MAVDPTECIAQSEHVLAAEVDGLIVLMRVEDGGYFSLDATGSEIWRRLGAPKRADALTADLRNDFDGDPATVERETLDFLSELKGSGLLVTVEDSQSAA